MSDAQVEEGLANPRNRLSVAGLKVRKEEEHFDRQSIFFKIGSPAGSTDFMVSQRFLSGFQRTEEYLQSTSDYIAAVAGRHKCGPPDDFCCLSGPTVEVSVRWPLQPGAYNNVFTSFILLTTTDLKTGKNSRNSIESVSGMTVFDIVAASVDTIRADIDAGKLQFVDPHIHQEVWKKVEQRQVDLTKPK